ncbi:MAG: MBL fold metallo-hydrolase [Clostridiales Family XIII bacterium]|jgi:glyoxylase-like metal-dependent hydrolase (beta-lactamase superfamily II)|nr:MBL fold metallo-hydrolase [Clostridiales Family XIII bacterium]
MNTEKITNRIERFKIRLPNNPLKNLNCYVIKGDDRNLLIDTGFHLPESFADLQEGIRALEVDMRRTDIFLTHCHADHTGNAGRIASASGVIYASAVDKTLTESFVRDHDALVRYFDACMVRDGFPETERALSLSTNPAAHNNERALFPIVAVPEGHSFDLGGVCLHTISTPGHTPGHMCLYIEEDGILFTGDHVLFDITPNITDWRDMEDSLGAYMDSLSKVRSMDVRRALPAHREGGDFAARTDALIRHHKARLEETLGVVSNTDGQTCYEVASKMVWRISVSDWKAFPPAQKFFAVGEARSHLRHLVLKGAIRVCSEGDTEYYFRN